MKVKLKEGSKARILSINYDHKAGKKLIDMGITPETTIEIKRVAPMGDPFIIEIRNYLLAVRKKDLAAAELEIVKNC
ncbi:MAG: hypothetical protein BGN88_11000 [Clostridiales bacterium 43-6]|nr:MAG: hypothetical protein BGN88_11000 [Clostridiales bacterium 43-6]